MSIEHVAALATAFGLGAVVKALIERATGRPGPSGADRTVAEASADESRAKADAQVWETIAGQLALLDATLKAQAIQIGDLTQALTAARVQIDNLNAEVERLRGVEASDKATIAAQGAEIERLRQRVAELEARAGGPPSALDGE